jgi:hypothetical protein
MKPEDIGRRFGIGVRVAGRIAKQRVEGGSAATVPATASSSAGASLPPKSPAPTAWRAETQTQVKIAGRAARAAGRGVGGFLRPFRRVGGILWLEVTGFFFGLFAAGFAFHLWQVRYSYASGPQHTQFLIAAGLTVVFGYLSISAFWRAQRK